MISRPTRRPTLEALEDRLTPASTLLFSVVAAQSSLSLSGTVLGNQLQPQGLGALSARYTGSVRAEIDLEANTVDFMASGTSLEARPTGSWSPLPGGAAGAATAAYAAAVNLLQGSASIAGRDIAVGLSTAAPLELEGTGDTRTFASDQTLSLIDGFIDYRPTGFAAALLPPGREPLPTGSAVNTAADGTLEDLGGGSYRLTLPIAVTFTGEYQGQSAQLTYSGTIVATAAVPSIDLNGTADGFNGALAYLEGDGPSLLAPDALLTGGNLNGATVTLAQRLDGVAERLALNLGTSGLRTTGYDPATGVLSLTGVAPAAVYQRVLRTLRYLNTSPSPTAAERAVSVLLTNGNESLERVASVAVADSAGDPIAVAPKSYRGTFGRALRVRAATGLLAGVTAVGTGTPRARIEVAPPARVGRLTVNADGSFTFTPALRRSTVRFQARAFDGTAWSAPFTVTMTFS